MERLRPTKPEPKTVIVLEVPDKGNLDGLLGGLVGAINKHAEAIAKPGTSLTEALSKLTSGGSNSEVLTAINNLSRKVDEFMASQEERLKTIQGQLTSVADGINTLQQQIADLKANNPELEDEIAGIESTVKGIADDLNPPAPDSGGGEPTT